ncbi:MAG: tRNA (adenosine(37)-N6)-threonylcarbamoyltransferase complex dimerization subunit type 1 TsaB [Chloroflexaceae bacterium]|jgi:tRNA threonylcarbamoyladenosine biosynthesis protein TsaB|nr:tRNA (adenosine(37)-N6)-threonylcarbamoyltransferase complex dimerization subunit type 1 TsaB [Chloroflexaceae bacterium]
MLLAIDTSTTLTSLACYSERGLLGECSWESRRNHTSQVLPQLQVLLRNLGVEQAQLQAVAVALGPGSWSGLRVGMSIAKGMALAGGLALLGVGTLEALAYQQRGAAMPIYPLVRLGRERFASARFEYRLGFARQSQDRNMSLAELAAEINDSALFCGEIDADVQNGLRQALGERAHFPGSAANMRRAGYLAELAWGRFQAGERDNLTTLEPIYLGEAVKVKREA